jgi:exopolyphosphatase / guanosine-5'-triphosphate,3'-diphosphate pyrophosphatase
VRVAALDCGTNSLRLLVVDHRDGTLHDVVRDMRVVRLGEGVDRTGELAPQALRRTFDALADYADQVRALAVERVRMVATAATRDAGNRDQFVDGVRLILGQDPEVVTGVEEAALSFRGATAELDPAVVAPPYLVADIGGGSTELVAAGGELARSMQIGCVRLTERHLHDDPPSVQQVAAAVAHVDGELAALAETFDRGRGHTLIGLAGSVTTTAALALGLPEYDAARIHLSRHSATDVRAVLDRLTPLSVAQRRALPAMHPGRADVILGGVLVLHRLLEQWGIAEVVASERDILDGIAWSLVDRDTST